MTATDTFDVFSTLDGYGSYGPSGDWGGYWGKATVYPVISGRTGTTPVFGGADDFDLDLVEVRTLGGRTQELIYRPARH
ncbi:MAG: hypothetical protein JWN62_3335 [Acidimicrobiales bacterium]|nr:hypothetical protein [Acidimicrobiales bacterium]